MSCKNFSGSWIKGAKGPTSDAIKKHFTSEMHKRGTDLALKRKLNPKDTLTMYAKIRPSGNQLQK